MRRIAVVTGSRAEYGLLERVVRSIHDDPALELQLIVTGSHLVAGLGDTVREIEAGGVPIAARVDMVLAADSPSGIIKSMGVGLLGMADVLERLTPDLLVVLGDRYELLASVQACLIARIPVAHIAGGDVTEGAYDDSIRHAITKMAHLHFVTNEPARARLIGMGELPHHVWNVGHVGLDDITDGELWSRQALEAELEVPLDGTTLLVTYHPETLSPLPATEGLSRLLSALAALPQELRIVFTYPNADTHGRTLVPLIKRFVADHDNAWAFPSLGRRRYLSLLAQVQAVVGNSSSGLYEVPSFKIPTVNIGDRQKGRIPAASVLTVPCTTQAIGAAIERALDMDCSAVANPYGGGGACRAIMRTLKAQPLVGLVNKPFYEGADR